VSEEERISEIESGRDMLEADLDNLLLGDEIEKKYNIHQHQDTNENY
jgi:hypothetical protein